MRYHLPLLAAAFLTLLHGCATAPTDGAPSQAIDFSDAADAIPRLEPPSPYGNPSTYEVHGQSYSVMEENSGYTERGIASWYGTKFHGRRTSSGEPYDMYAMSAAHRSLRLPAYVKVINLNNDRSTVVRVNDRGPFHPERIIDLSYAAANKLGFIESGTAPVEISVIIPGESPVPEPFAPTSTGTIPASPTNPTPPASAESPATAPPTETPPRIYLQLAVFTRRESADQLRTQLHTHQLTNTVIQEEQHLESTLYKVRLGPIEDTTEADRLANHLNELGLGMPYIVIE